MRRASTCGPAGTGLLWVRCYRLHCHGHRLPTSRLLTPASPRWHTRGEVRRPRPGKVSPARAPKRVRSLPAPASRQGRGCAARPSPANYTSHNALRPSILAGGRWLPGVWPFRPPGPFCSPPARASAMRGARPRRVGCPGAGSSHPPRPLLHPGSPAHVPAKRWRTQTPASPRPASASTQRPPPLSRRPCFRSARENPGGPRGAHILAPGA